MASSRSVAAWTSSCHRPLTLTVDLAGDEPVPVAGTILDPSAGPGVVAGTPRDFELVLSQDGVTYETVLTGQLSGALAEQAFVLPEPVPARFAQLLITSIHPASTTSASASGRSWPPRAGSRAPLRWTSPTRPSAGTSPGSTRSPPASSRSTACSTRTRHHRRLARLRSRADATRRLGAGLPGRSRGPGDRAAVAGPAATDPNIRLERLELASSMDGPLGPWTPLGSWDARAGCERGGGTLHAGGADLGALPPHERRDPEASHRDRRRAAGCAPRARAPGVGGLPLGGRRVGLRLVGGPFEWQQPVDAGGEGVGGMDDGPPACR